MSSNEVLNVTCLYSLSLMLIKPQTTAGSLWGFAQKLTSFHRMKSLPAFPSHEICCSPSYKGSLSIYNLTPVYQH